MHPPSLPPSHHPLLHREKAVGKWVPLCAWHGLTAGRATARLHLVPLLRGVSGSTLFPAGDPRAQPLPPPFLESFLPEQWQPCSQLPACRLLFVPLAGQRAAEICRGPTQLISPRGKTNAKSTKHLRSAAPFPARHGDAPNATAAPELTRVTAGAPPRVAAGPQSRPCADTDSAPRWDRGHAGRRHGRSRGRGSRLPERKGRRGVTPCGRRPALQPGVELGEGCGRIDGCPGGALSQTAPREKQRDEALHHGKSAPWEHRRCPGSPAGNRGLLSSGRGRLGMAQMEAGSYTPALRRHAEVQHSTERVGSSYVMPRREN